MSNHTNYANHTVRAYLMDRFPGLVCEIPIVPKRERKSKKGAKPPVPGVQIEPPKDKRGWTGTCGGPTVETMIAAPGLLAAHLRQRYVQKVLKGPIPENFLTEEMERWNTYIGTPETGNKEFFDACARMILALKAKRAASQSLVQVGEGDQAITFRITARKDKDSTLSRLILLYLKDGVPVFVENARGKMVPVEVENLEIPQESNVEAA